MEEFEEWTRKAEPVEERLHISVQKPSKGKKWKLLSPAAVKLTRKYDKKKMSSFEWLICLVFFSVKSFVCRDKSQKTTKIKGCRLKFLLVKVCIALPVWGAQAAT